MDPNAPILMSAENPTGWKLDELLERLQNEIRLKSAKIEADPRMQAKCVRINNDQIINLLGLAASTQRHSMLILESIGPNQGPTGTPRIGVGSKT